ncbi:hypothetical protein [Mariniflexile rhizosphaerae]|uniref:hypothetical protein n=1 Tax=unclassified Mariniflexile TaxID=2643887 RepID=UPI000E3C5B44|nr:hypothetical protein [Mariniflexile sp. TRM1-10]
MEEKYIKKLKKITALRWAREYLGNFLDSSEPPEYREDICYLLYLTGLKENDLLREIVHVSLSLKDTAKFYALTGRFPTTEECELISKIGIYNFSIACNRMSLFSKCMSMEFSRGSLAKIGDVVSLKK